MAGGMGHGSGSQSTSADQASLQGAPSGKGTSEAAPTGTRDMPPSVMSRYSGAPQSDNWRDTLARGINQQQMRAAATPMPTGDYNQMVSQALLGKKWEDLVPQPAKKEEPAAAPAPAPDKIAEMQAQIDALSQRPAVASVYDPYPGATMTTGFARGGMTHGYAAGGSPSEDEILKLAFNIIRRKFQ